MTKVKIIGAGLAGCEAAYQLSKRGYKCVLYDIKPQKFTPAHSNPDFGELVCSNSLKSMAFDTASGVLKEELRLLDSLCISAALNCSVNNGETLSVDRSLFAKTITQRVLNDKNIEFISAEIEDFDESEPVIIATGPLTCAPLIESLKRKFGKVLNFFDAAAPIISTESIDFSKVFIANRYNKGDASYVNCPLNKEEYEIFVNELINAKTAVLKEFENCDVFEGCMPVEIMAKRGADTLRFGPLKPVGLYDTNGKRPYAVVQLRRENALGQMYNIVGFQTNLTFTEQKRVFGLIPALRDAEFLRYGVMHRNSFINAPAVLKSGFRTTAFTNVFIAGQLSGVEGYCESIMSGLVSALSFTYGHDFTMPLESISGALTNYLTAKNTNFQPMNANFGLLPPLKNDIPNKKLRRQMLGERAISSIEVLARSLN